MKFAGAALILLGLIGFTLLSGAPTAGTVSRQEQMTPSDQLEREHLVILSVIDAAKTEAEAIRKQESPDTKRVRQMVDFFSSFVDGCHHAKEERFYFLSAVYHGPAAVDGLVRELRMEHAYARSIIEELQYVLDHDKQNADFIAERLATYAALVEKHIRSETEQLFPKADVYITGAEERAVRVGFEKIEKVDLGPGFHEKYHAMAEDLANPSESSE